MPSNRVRTSQLRQWTRAIAAACISLSAAPCLAREAGADYILEHVQDSHVWHFATVGGHHLTLYLPVLLYKPGAGFFCFSSRRFWDAHHAPAVYQGFHLAGEKVVSIEAGAVIDLSLTKVVMNILLCLLCLLLIFAGLARRLRMVKEQGSKHGIWVLPLEYVLFVRNLARQRIGAGYERFLPFLLTLFSFIWLSNTAGLLPGAANVTGNLAVTLGLSLATLLVSLANGSAEFWHHFFRPPGIPVWLLPIMVPVEIIGLITKYLTLTMRLFANILAGHLVLLSIISIIFILDTIFAALVVVPLGVFMIVLKLGVAFFQAYLFTLLSATSIGQAIKTHSK